VLEKFPKPRPVLHSTVAMIGLMDEAIKGKGKDGKYKHNIMDDLKDMNTDPAGNCKCIQCDTKFIYDETGVNMCKKCVKEMF
jgi:hypothetical protein